MAKRSIGEIDKFLSALFDSRCIWMSADQSSNETDRIKASLSPECCEAPGLLIPLSALLKIIFASFRCTYFAAKDSDFEAGRRWAI
jgi:hypothetical protein